MKPRLRQMVTMKYRNPFRVVLPDIHKQGFRGRESVRLCFLSMEGEQIVVSYRNENTGRIDVTLHFPTEADREAALGQVAAKFRHFRVV